MRITTSPRNLCVIYGVNRNLDGGLWSLLGAAEVYMEGYTVLFRSYYLTLDSYLFKLLTSPRDSALVVVVGCRLHMRFCGYAANTKIASTL